MICIILNFTPFRICRTIPSRTEILKLFSLEFPRKSYPLRTVLGWECTGMEVVAWSPSPEIFSTLWSLMDSTHFSKFSVSILSVSFFATPNRLMISQ